MIGNSIPFLHGYREGYRMHRIHITSDGWSIFVWCFALTLLCFWRTNTLYPVAPGFTPAIVFAVSLWILLSWMVRSLSVPNDDVLAAAAAVTAVEDMVGVVLCDAMRILLFDALLFAVLFVLRRLWNGFEQVYMALQRNKVKRQCFRICSRVFAAAAAVLLLAVFAGLDRYAEYYVMPGSFAADQAVAVSTGEENALNTSQREEASAAVSEIRAAAAEWERLSDAEKKRIVRLTVKAEHLYLGLTGDPPTVVFRPISDDCMGKYSHFDRTILFDSNHLKDDSAASVLQTAIHEMHHAYVHQTVSALNFDSDVVRNNRYFNQLRDWKENLDHYISAEDDYDLYRSQSVEADAFAYAWERAPIYLGDANTLDMKRTEQ